MAGAAARRRAARPQSFETGNSGTVGNDRTPPSARIPSGARALCYPSLQALLPRAWRPTATRIGTRSTPSSSRWPGCGRSPTGPPDMAVKHARKAFPAPELLSKTGMEPATRDSVQHTSPSQRKAASSRQSHSAHHTEQVTVHYPWHPLHGQTIRVQRSVRHGRDVWLCEQEQRTAAIPVWMTDRAACAALSVGPVLVSVDALRELASLVVTATRSAAHDRITHPSQEEPDATSTTDANAHPVRTRGAGGPATGIDRAGLGEGLGRSAARQRGGRRSR